MCQDTITTAVINIVMLSGVGFVVYTIYLLQQEHKLRKKNR